VKHFTTLSVQPEGPRRSSCALSGLNITREHNGASDTIPWALPRAVTFQPFRLTARTQGDIRLSINLGVAQGCYVSAFQADSPDSGRHPLVNQSGCCPGHRVAISFLFFRSARRADTCQPWATQGDICLSINLGVAHGIGSPFRSFFSVQPEGLTRTSPGQRPGSRADHSPFLAVR
jgi:hypothetical protein